ncbi:MAG: O-antigen ligase family protein [Oscillospiraceae bacterium]|nr:O-antigen ligase family protein [Oscillospiraceae bacterium]
MSDVVKEKSIGGGRGSQSLGNALFILLILQPLLDVASYFAVLHDVTTVTSVARMLLFTAAVIYCFSVSSKKRAYIIMFGVLVLFWICHVISCFHAGYKDPFSDFSYYLRTIHMPVLTLCFITVFRNGDAVPDKIQKAFTINLFIIIAVLVITLVSGQRNYTYEYHKLGFIGWAAVDNCQSAIVTLITPIILYYAYRKSKALFAVCALAAFGQMFLIGTRLALYSILIFSVCMMVIFAFNREKRLYFYAVMLLSLILCLCLWQQSPNYKYTQSHDVVVTLRQEYNDGVFEEADSDREAYMEVYSNYLPGLVSRFGLDTTLSLYNYSKDPDVIVDVRQAKLNFAALAWEKCDTLTRVLGFEYETLIEDNNVYDLENDFPSIFYFYGYAGIALYILFLLYFIALIIKSLIADFSGTFTVEAGVVGLTLVIILAAAQLSGNVLRRPNVSIYLSLILAYSYYLTSIKGNASLLPKKKKLKEDT